MVVRPASVGASAAGATLVAGLILLAGCVGRAPARIANCRRGDGEQTRGPRSDRLLRVSRPDGGHQRGPNPRPRYGIHREGGFRGRAAGEEGPRCCSRSIPGPTKRSWTVRKANWNGWKRYARRPKSTWRGAGGCALRGRSARTNMNSTSPN